VSKETKKNHPSARPVARTYARRAEVIEKKVGIIYLIYSRRNSKVHGDKSSLEYKAFKVFIGKSSSWLDVG
jgi:hypothetical protein